MSNDIATPIIEAQTLCRTFQDGTRPLAILQDVNMSIHAGETIAIIGPSGSGKSTLLHCLGLLDRPTSGTILFHGKDIAKASEREQNRLRNLEIGFVFQHYHLLPDLSVLENVRLPGRIAKRPQARQRAMQLLESVGLANRMHHSPKTLSGGERQRAALARALGNNPSLLLCDEPTGNLDPHTASGILDLLFSTFRAEHTAAVIVTHDMTIAKRADRILQITEGHLCQYHADTQDAI